MVENFLGVARLDDSAQVHDGHAVGHMPHHGQVMGNEDVGDSEFLLEVIEQVEDLRLDGKIQRGDRFIQDDDVRVEGQRTGNADAVAAGRRKTPAGIYGRPMGAAPPCAAARRTRASRSRDDG